ncbi:hypothetical protein ACTFIU_010780 [Dictyostelium citrinum]
MVETLVQQYRSDIKSFVKEIRDHIDYTTLVLPQQKILIPTPFCNCFPTELFVTIAGCSTQLYKNKAIVVFHLVFIISGISFDKTSRNVTKAITDGNNNNCSSNSNNCRDNNSSRNTITTTDISTAEQHSKNNNSNINKSNNNSSNINNSNNIVKTTLPTHKYNNELHRTLGMNPSQASSREPLFLSQPTVGSLYKVVSQITTNSDQTKPDVHSFLKK